MTAASRPRRASAVGRGSSKHRHSASRSTGWVVSNGRATSAIIYCERLGFFTES